MSTQEEQGKEGKGSRVSRRKFLGAVGASAAVAAPAIVLSLPQEVRAQSRRRFQIRPDRFTRIFPDLPPFATASPALEAALTEIGAPGGMMDAKDNLAAGPVLLISDPALRVNNPDNPTHGAGVTFLGQFLDHDLTFDLSSALGVAGADPALIQNERTPAMDLDTVYGGGPRRSPELYVPGLRGRAGIKFRIETGGLFEDLPRTADNIAIIGDPRNDENLMLSGIQAFMLKFHNNAVDFVTQNSTRRRLDAEDIFREARRLTTWHHQWHVVHEYLVQICGEDVVQDVLFNGPRFFRPRTAQIPVEWSVAVHRLGHSQVRPSYRANLAGNPDGTAFFGFIFDPAGEGQADPVDLRGDARAPRRFIGWQTFFPFPGVDAAGLRTNKIIDTTMSTPLFNLPRITIAGGGLGPTSLATRNLLRAVTFGIPSGQAVAQAMGMPVLTAADFSDLAQFGVGLETSTPLWFYILREAQLAARGLTLGPVGARIEAEVFIRLLQLDPNSYFQQAGWQPTLPQLTGQLTGQFTMSDFITFAGSAPPQRRLESGNPNQ